MFLSCLTLIQKSDIEECHRRGKANPKTQLFVFVNGKYAEEALAKKSSFKKIGNVNLNFESNIVLFFSENLTPFNQHLAWKCCELKCDGKFLTF